MSDRATRRLAADERGDLERALGAWLGHVPPYRVAACLRGLSNRSYRVIVPHDATGASSGSPLDVVVRLPGPARDLPVDRTIERRVALAAASAGVAPRVHHADAAAGVLVVDHVEGARPLTADDLRRPATLSAVARTFASLHAMPPLGRAMDPRAVLEGYRRRLAAGASGEPPVRPPARRILERAARVAESLDVDGPLVPSLVDASGGNVLLTARGEIRLVDFEYAADAPPPWDLTELAASIGIGAAAAARLLAASGVELPGGEDALTRWRLLCDAIAGAWALVAGEEALAHQRLGACARALETVGAAG